MIYGKKCNYSDLYGNSVFRLTCSEKVSISVVGWLSNRQRIAQNNTAVQIVVNKVAETLGDSGFIQACESGTEKDRVGHHFFKVYKKAE